MNIEEARKTIEELLNSNEPICEYMLKHQEIEAIQKLLNELEKKDKQIEEAYKEGYRKGALPQVLENWNNENARIVKINKIEEKKDKVIDMMAQELINQPIRVMTGNEIFKFTNKEDTLEYFYNKIGGNIDKKQTK